MDLTDLDRLMPLVAWETIHRPHGILLSAPSAKPGFSWHLCPCGCRLVTVTPDKPVIS